MPRRRSRNLLAYIAVHVRRLRLARGLTQDALAERAGLELRYIQKVERAEVNMGVLILAAIAEALEVSPGELFEPTRALPASKRGRPAATPPKPERTSTRGQRTPS